MPGSFLLILYLEHQTSRAMKKLFYFITVTTTLSFLASCTSSGNMASSFGKRKYTKGYYIDMPSTNNNTAIANTQAPESHATLTVTKNTSSTETISPAIAIKKTSEVVYKTPKATKSVSAIPVVNNAAPKTTTMTNMETVATSSAASPLTETTATRYTGGNSKWAIFGCIIAAVGFLMVFPGQIGWLLVPVICLVGLLFCIQGLLTRDHKTLAIIGALLGAAGLILWIVGIIGGGLTFTFI
jgi:hypothetical protein